MKKSCIAILLLIAAPYLFSQTKYPDPEFNNEVYYLKKDSVNTVVRLEKNSSKTDNKTKAAGFGGIENAYEIEGERSSVRFASGTNLSFIFSNGASSVTPNHTRDSIMRANGMDPSMAQSMGGGFMDPGNQISLYKTETGKNKRRIILQKIGGAFGSKKPTSSDKFTFSVKKIRDGYWELVVDKPLAKGEYAFTMMDMTNVGSINAGPLVFAFAID